MLPVNYHHLYYFWVTAKAGSITKARDQLLLAQPTLSLQIRQLEKDLGKKLLQRSRQGVSLTADGRVAFEYCQRIFANGEALVSAFKEQKEPAIPVIRIGATKAISRWILLSVLDAIQKYEPRARSTIFTGTIPELTDRLERHALDIALADVDFSRQLGAGFHSRLAMSLPVRFMAAPKMRSELSGVPSAGTELPMLLREPQNPIRKEVDGFLTSHRLRLLPVAETEDADLIRILATRGWGVVALSDLAAQRDLHEKRLVPLRWGPSGIKEYVWFHASVYPDPNPGVQRALRGLMTKFTKG